VICVGCVYRNSADLQNIQFVGRQCLHLDEGMAHSLAVDLHED